jgi:serpin B
MGKTVADLVNGLTGESWQRYMYQFDDTPGTVYLPKFKLEYETELNDALKALGMEVAFDEQRADFSNLVPPPDRVLINQVKHKTFIEVNEEFTEAAAVTSVGMVFATSIRMPKLPFVLDLNRPFLTAIRDNWTGAVLFLGAIVEPK